HREFMQAFFGAPAQDVEGGIAVEISQGVVEVLTPASFTDRYGVAAPDTGHGARLAALRFAVGDPARLQGLPRAGRMAGADSPGRVVIGAADAMGAVLVFERAR